MHVIDVLAANNLQVAAACLHLALWPMVMHGDVCQHTSPQKRQFQCIQLTMCPIYACMCVVTVGTEASQTLQPHLRHLDYQSVGSL